jgi:hypothetical protein
MEPKAEKPQKPAPSGIRDNPRPFGTPRPHTYKSSGRVRSWVPNRSTRFTEHLSEAKVIDLIEASVHAREIGRPLNRFITIHLERGDIVGRPQEAVGHFLRMAGQWLGDREVPSTFVWVLEQAAGTGLHAHILIHCPPELAKDFSNRARSRWLSLSSIEPRKGVIKTERVGPRGFTMARASQAERQSYQNQLQGVLRYITKAIDPEAKSTLARHLPHAARPTTAELLRVEPEYCAPIYGRRCSRSQNIGATARARYDEQRASQEGQEAIGRSYSASRG